MLPQQPITTEADTGINAFNLGQPFFAKRLTLSRNWPENNNEFGFLGIFEYLTYVGGYLSLSSFLRTHHEYTLESSLSSIENIDVKYCKFLISSFGNTNNKHLF